MPRIPRLRFNPNYRDATLSTAPATYWRVGLSDIGDVIAHDEMGANDGTYVGSPTLGVAGLLAGDSDTAVTLNGTNQYAGFADTLMPMGNSARTLACWMNPTTLGGNSPWVGYGTSIGGGHWCYLYVTAAGQVRLYDGTDERQLSAAGAVVTGVGQFVAVTFDGTNWVAYVTGVPSGSPLALSVNTTSTFGYIGYNGGAYFNGTIDEPAVWDRALTPGEIAGLHRIGRGW